MAGIDAQRCGSDLRRSPENQKAKEQDEKSVGQKDLRERIAIIAVGLGRRTDPDS
jgi:hypothetical protein